MQLFTIIRISVIVAALALAHQATQGETTGDLIAKGDKSDVSFRASEALVSYHAAEKLDPGNVDLLVRIARQYRHLMADAASNKDKIKLGAIALEYSEKAAKLGPKNSDAQLSTAITYGKLLPYQGKKEQVAASLRIKASADRAIKLDPRNDSAWHVLGRWHQSLANVSGAKRALGGALYGKLPTGTNEESIACFDKAIAINPQRLRHYIEKGRTHAQMGDKVSAKRFINKGMAMPNKEKDDPEIKARGRETLAKL